MMFLMDNIRPVHEKFAGDLFHQNHRVRRTAQRGKQYIGLKDLFSVALLRQSSKPFLYQKHVNMILLLSVLLASDLLLCVYLRVLILLRLQYLRLYLKFYHQNGETYSDLLYLMHNCGSLGLLRLSIGPFLI